MSQALLHGKPNASKAPADLGVGSDAQIFAAPGAMGRFR